MLIFVNTSKTYLTNIVKYFFSYQVHNTLGSSVIVNSTTRNYNNHPSDCLNDFKEHPVSRLRKSSNFLWVC